MNDKDNPANDQVGESLAYSLRHMTADSITPSPAVDPDAARKERGRGMIRKIILAVCVCVFVYSLFSIFTTLSGYRKAEDFYKNLLDDITGNDPAVRTLLTDAETPRFGARTDHGGNSEDGALFKRMKARLNLLEAQNPDICGWINIPGTKNINYPILQGEDNDYYLDHEFTGGYLAAGSIFLDYRCDRDFNGNHNTVIYGHNMQNGMMFSEIISFLDERFFNENRYIYVYTDFGVYTYEIFAIYKADYTYKYIETDFMTHADFVDFAYEMKSNSMYPRDGIEFNENSRIITLSTCTNGLWRDRYCLQALLVGAYND